MDLQFNCNPKFKALFPYIVCTESINCMCIKCFPSVTEKDKTFYSVWQHKEGDINCTCYKCVGAGGHYAYCINESVKHYVLYGVESAECVCIRPVNEEVKKTTNVSNDFEFDPKLGSKIIYNGETGVRRSVRNEAKK